MAKKIHHDKPARIALGKPFDNAIKKILFPKTNRDNLSTDWNSTDWVRYCVAKELAFRNNGKIPKDCKDMLKNFSADLDL